MNFRLPELFDDIPPLLVVDIGASVAPNLGYIPPYQALLEGGDVRVIGFEPDPAQYAKVLEVAEPHTTCLPDAIGDGGPAELRICRAMGMNSLLEPAPEVLKHFHLLADWAQVHTRLPINTRRLDDVPEVANADFIKIDVQGSELAVLQGGKQTMGQGLAVHIEAQFVPFYADQPTFGEIDTELRGGGYFLHGFAEMQRRTFKPLVVGNDPFKGINQLLWADAVYYRAFTAFEGMEPHDLLKVARIAHDVSQSPDLAGLALRCCDEMEGTKRWDRYLERVVG